MKEILKQTEQAMLSLRKLYARYGYMPYKMSRFEEYDLYVQNKDFLVSDQIVTFSDRNGRLLALKPDVTLSIIKNVKDIPGFVRKLYYNENVYRGTKETGTLREIMQSGLECVGDLSGFEIDEVVLLAAKSLELLNSEFVLDLSHMGLLEAVLQRSGLTGERISRAVTFLHQKNAHEMGRLCQEAGCSSEATELLNLLSGTGDQPDRMLSLLEPLLETREEKTAFEELRHICRILDQQGFTDCVRIDFSAGSHMKYYSGIMFSGYLQGLPAAILSGGQYDKLLRKMDRKGNAIGFAIYLDMLEQLQREVPAYDVDILLLQGEEQNSEVLMRTAETLRKQGSVLVSAGKVSDRKWRKLMRMENGEAVVVEEDG